MCLHEIILVELLGPRLGKSRPRPMWRAMDWPHHQAYDDWIRNNYKRVEVWILGDQELVAHSKTDE